MSNVTNDMKGPFALTNKRFASFFPSMIGKMVRIPAYVGGGAAAFGSYVAYKVNEAGQFTQDQLSKFKDFTGDVKDKLGDWFQRDGQSDDGGNSGDNNGSDAVAAATLLASLSDDENDDEGKTLKNQHDEEESADGKRRKKNGNDEDEEDDDLEEAEDNTQDEMLNLTKQMIEIRSILNKVDSTSANLALPSIVVIGSQSCLLYTSRCV